MFIVINIGCIECGVTSNIVGVFTDRAEAETIAEACEKEYAWREGGQNRFEVFTIPEVGVIHPEYANVLHKGIKHVL